MVTRTCPEKHWPCTETAMAPGFCVETKGSFPGSDEPWLILQGLWNHGGMEGLAFLLGERWAHTGRRARGVGCVCR